jgi:hypothetical protein
VKSSHRFKAAFRIVLGRAVCPLLIAVMVAGICAGLVRAEEFLSVLDDMPLAPGLTELADQAAEFETPAGRIVDAAASGAVQAATVAAFYDRTLPALGWIREGAGRFVRDQERLTIATGVGPGKGQVVVRFSLRPRAGAEKR